jgi:predicted DNA binding CopG/RHH family protein
MSSGTGRPEVPKFATEAEEAKWWDNHRDMIEENLIQALDTGTAERGIARRVVRELRAARNVTIRIAEADLDLARKQAQEQGLPYQTYIKSVLHQALVQRERGR